MHRMHINWKTLHVGSFIWAATWQNQQKWVCAQRRHRSAWASAQVWSESSVCAQWVAKDPRFLCADSEDSDQTGRMPRLIWVFAGRTPILLVLSCRSSSIKRGCLRMSLMLFVDGFFLLVRKSVKYQTLIRIANLYLQNVILTSFFFFFFVDRNLIFAQFDLVSS